MESTLQVKKVWTRVEIENMLRINSKAVERGILALYRRQTDDEKNSHETRHDNGVGFSAYAARSGTYWAKAIMSSNRPEGHRLWGKALEKSRKICLRHVRQLVAEANK